MNLLRNYVLTGIFILGLFNSIFAQTDITIFYKAGHKEGFKIQPDGKIYFENESLIIKESASSQEISIETDLIRKFTFEELAGSHTSKGNTIVNHLVISPNPAQQSIKFVSELDKDLFVKIYDNKGRLSLSQSHKTNTDLDISQLVPGIYMIQADGLILKMVKL